MENVFIFTIAYKCGKIADKALQSFHKYHNKKVVIFTTKSEFDLLTPHKNNILFDLTNDNNLELLYTHGHAGTANIWARVIKKEFGDYSKVIQFDSDVIFFEDCLSDVITAFDEGYDLIGPRRAYINTTSNNIIPKEILTNLQDVVSTFFIGVNIDKISNHNFSTIENMACGRYNPLGFPVIDFFDPISFDILNNGGKIKYLDFRDYGSCDENGNFDNGYLNLNSPYDYGKKIIHFAGIGSGMNFHNNGHTNVPITYVMWAKKRYALYMKLFYEPIDEEYDIEMYNTTKTLFENNE